MSGEVKLTKAMRDALRFIVREGPGTLPDTKAERTTATVCRLLDAGFIETLNRLRPGPPIYEITSSGLAVLQGGDK